MRTDRRNDSSKISSRGDSSNSGLVEARLIQIVWENRVNDSYRLLIQLLPISRKVPYYNRVWHACNESFLDKSKGAMCY